MATVETPDLVWVTAQEVLDCVCEALAEQSSCGCPCRSFVTINQPVWDECCEGQLALVMQRMYVMSNFPAANAQPIVCSSPLAADFTLQLIRCVPTMTETGVAPTAQELSDSAAQLYSDLYIAYRAVICCLAAYKKARLFTMRDGRMVGPQGGCAGFEIQFTVQLVDPVPVI